MAATQVVVSKELKAILAYTGKIDQKIIQEIRKNWDWVLKGETQDSFAVRVEFDSLTLPAGFGSTEITGSEINVPELKSNAEQEQALKLFFDKFLHYLMKDSMIKIWLAEKDRHQYVQRYLACILMLLDKSDSTKKNPKIDDDLIVKFKVFIRLHCGLNLSDKYLEFVGDAFMKALSEILKSQNRKITMESWKILMKEVTDYMTLHYSYCSPQRGSSRSFSAGHSEPKSGSQAAAQSTQVAKDQKPGVPITFLPMGGKHNASQPVRKKSRCCGSNP